MCQNTPPKFAASGNQTNKNSPFCRGIYSVNSPIYQGSGQQKRGPTSYTFLGSINRKNCSICAIFLSGNPFVEIGLLYWSFTGGRTRWKKIYALSPRGVRDFATIKNLNPDPSWEDTRREQKRRLSRSVIPTLLMCHFFSLFCFVCLLQT